MMINLKKGKWLACVLAIILCFGCAVASAATAEELGLCTLLANGRVVGTAVAWQDGETLLTSAEIPGDAEVVTMMNGIGTKVAQTVRLASGVTMLKLESAVYAAPVGSVVRTDGLYYAGIDANGVSVTGEVKAAAAALVNGHSALVLTIEDAMLPGAALFNADGTLAGLVMTSTGEQGQRYSAYTMESLFWMMHAGSIGAAISPAPVPADR